MLDKKVSSLLFHKYDWNDDKSFTKFKMQLVILSFPPCIANVYPHTCIHLAYTMRYFFGWMMYIYDFTSTPSTHKKTFRKKV